jgi:Zn ribbon nucleic-acid-binding protein
VGKLAVYVAVEVVHCAFQQPQAQGEVEVEEVSRPIQEAEVVNLRGEVEEVNLLGEVEASLRVEAQVVAFFAGGFVG